MKAICFATVVLLLVGGPMSVRAQADDIDLLSVFTRQPGMAERLGLAKLTDEEKAAWNEVLNVLLQAANRTADTALSPLASLSPSSRGAAFGVFEGTVDETDGNVVQLSNGAIAEVTGYLGYVGYRTDAMLVRDRSGWRLWIEGKQTYSARLLREPAAWSGRGGELVNISEVLGNGAVLRLLDGRILEVSAIDQVSTGIWLGFSRAILIDGYELLNLDRGQKVRITAIR